MQGFSGREKETHSKYRWFRENSLSCFVAPVFCDYVQLIAVFPRLDRWFVSTALHGFV
jgi:hypothetical protein